MNDNKKWSLTYYKRKINEMLRKGYPKIAESYYQSYRLMGGMLSYSQIIQRGK